MAVDASPALCRSPRPRTKLFLQCGGADNSEDDSLPTGEARKMQAGVVPPFFPSVDGAHEKKRASRGVKGKVLHLKTRTFIPEHAKSGKIRHANAQSVVQQGCITCGSCLERLLDFVNLRGQSPCQ